mgnify:CR=1 FL=1
MLADFYIPRLSNNMEIAVQQNKTLGRERQILGQILKHFGLLVLKHFEIFKHFEILKHTGFYKV